MALRRPPRAAALAGLLALAAAPAMAGGPLAGDTARVIEARVVGPSFPDMSGPARLPDGSMSMETRQSVGCLILGTTMAGVGAVAGATNLIHLVGGGVVPVQNQAILYLSTIAVTFGTFCAIGATLTPLWDAWGDTAPAAAPAATTPPAAPMPARLRLLPVQAQGVLADRLHRAGAVR